MEGIDQYFETLRRAIKKKRRWFSIPMFISGIFIGILIGQLILILLLENKEVAKYLQNTFILAFDGKEFRFLCEEAGCSVSHAKYLIFMYYSSHVFAALGFLSNAFGYFARSAFKYSIGSKVLLAYRTMLLEQYIGIQISGLNPKIKRKSEKLVKEIDLYSVISPLKKNWQKEQIYNWFRKDIAFQKKYRILGSLSIFNSKATFCIKRSQDLGTLKKALHELATYLFLANTSRDKNGYGRETVDRPILDIYLDNFVRIMATIKAKQDEIRMRPENAIKKYPMRFAASENLQRSIKMAIAAGIVGVVGCWIFKIDAKTMFIAWFTVVFGGTLISVTISETIQKRRK